MSKLLILFSFVFLMTSCSTTKMVNPKRTMGESTEEFYLHLVKNKDIDQLKSNSCFNSSESVNIRNTYIGNAIDVYLTFYVGKKSYVESIDHKMEKGKYSKTYNFKRKYKASYERKSCYRNNDLYVSFLPIK